MASFDTTAALIADIGQRGILDGDPVTALYASAGADTKPFTFTHPEFFARRGLADVPVPNVHVLVDVRRQEPPRFSDADTTIETLDIAPVRAGPVEMRLAHVHYASTSFAPRDLAVLLITADNRQIQPIWASESWLPDIFIGVCDGCRYGGNPREACVNRLNVPDGMSQSEAEQVQVPAWWITDHCLDARRYGEVGPGDHIVSLDDRFPFTYRKVALLSSDWGTYADHAMAGATLFAVKRRGAVPAVIDPE